MLFLRWPLKSPDLFSSVYGVITCWLRHFYAFWCQCLVSSFPSNVLLPVICAGEDIADASFHSDSDFVSGCPVDSENQPILSSPAFHSYSNRPSAHVHDRPCLLYHGDEMRKYLFVPETFIPDVTQRATCCFMCRLLCVYVAAGCRWCQSEIWWRTHGGWIGISVKNKLKLFILLFQTVLLLFIFKDTFFSYSNKIPAAEFVSDCR